MRQRRERIEAQMRNWRAFIFFLCILYLIEIVVGFDSYDHQFFGLVAGCFFAFIFTALAHVLARCVLEKLEQELF